MLALDLVSVVSFADGLNRFADGVSNHKVRKGLGPVIRVVFSFELLKADFDISGESTDVWCLWLTLC